MTPLAIDLFCGLGGWTDGLLAEGYRVIGFDNERHRYPAREFSLSEESGKGMSGQNHHGTTLIGAAREQVHGYHRAPMTGGWIQYPAQLVIQDVLTLHGAQFRNAALIVASPPCQAYSYRAMPWKRAKALPPPSNELFEACFRIQREASEAAGHHIPLVVENVCGAQKWVGRARWHHGSFYLWGDVPALMPIIGRKGIKGSVGTVNGSGKHREQSPWDRGEKVAGFRFDGSGGSFQTASVQAHREISTAWRMKHYDDTAKMQLAGEGVKQGGDWFNAEQPSISRLCGSKSTARKAASAHIAKIPLPLARHIGRAWAP